MTSNFFDIPSGNICVYPYSDEVLPVLHYAELLSSSWNITSLISPKSWGYVGRQITYNKSSLMVSSSFDDLPECVDYVLIPEFFGSINSAFVTRQILSRIVPVLDRLRGVLLSTILDDENYLFLQSACEGVCELIDLNQLSTNYVIENRIEYKSELYDIDVPVVGIVGMWEETDKFEVSLALRAKFMSDGYRVSQIGSRNYCEIFGFHSFPRLMLDPKMGEEDKILRFNQYLKIIEKEEDPDVILLSIPGGTQKLNNKFTNRFGILPFFVSKAISFDSLVLCTLYESNAGELFEMISNSFQYKYGCKADAFHMSNTIFDSTSINEKQIMKLNHISRSDVAKAVKDNYADLSSPMVNAFEPDGVDKLYRVLISKLTGIVADTIN